MQIPLTPPDHTTPLPARREVQALSPVTPTPGVESQAETLDTRLALQWTQPVLGDHSADIARSALERIQAVQSQAHPSSPTSNPNTHAAVSWSSLAQVLGPLLERMAAHPADEGVAWPGYSKAMAAGEAPTTEPPHTSPLLQALQRIYAQLTQSDLFAAQHLARHWFRPPQPNTASDDPPPPDSMSPETLSRWVEALSPESQNAEHVTRLLVHGKMSWQGELLPGIAVTLEREDAWREDPKQPGQAQKGAALCARMHLPHSGGQLTVRACQWGDRIDVRVNLPPQGQEALRAAWPDLETRLAALHLADLYLERRETP